MRVLLLLALISVAACSAPDTTRVDASTEAALHASLQALVNQAPDRKAKAAQAALSTFRSAYWPQEGTPVPGLPDWRLVDRMTLEEFVHFASRVQRMVRVRERPEYPVVRDIREAYRGSLELDRALLEDARERAHLSDRFTIDQFAFGNLDVQLPEPDAAKGADEIRFVVPLTNHTGFDVYRPSIRLSLYRSDNPQPVYDVELMSLDQEVISPGETSEIIVRCCTSTSDPKMNALIRNLPAGYRWQWSLVDVHNYAGRSSLDTKSYRQAQHDELLRIRECLEDMDRQGEGWTPRSAALACNG